MDYQPYIPVSEMNFATRVKSCLRAAMKHIEFIDSDIDEEAEKNHMKALEKRVGELYYLVDVVSTEEREYEQEAEIDM